MVFELEEGDAGLSPTARRELAAELERARSFETLVRGLAHRLTNSLHSMMGHASSSDARPRVALHASAPSSFSRPPSR